MPLISLQKGIRYSKALCFNRTLIESVLIMLYFIKDSTNYGIGNTNGDIVKELIDNSHIWCQSQGHSSKRSNFQVIFLNS